MDWLTVCPGVSSKFTHIFKNHMQHNSQLVSKCVEIMGALYAKLNLSRLSDAELVTLDKKFQAVYDALRLLGSSHASTLMKSFAPVVFAHCQILHQSSRHLLESVLMSLVDVDYEPLHNALHNSESKAKISECFAQRWSHLLEQFPVAVQSASVAKKTLAVQLISGYHQLFEYVWPTGYTDELIDALKYVYAPRISRVDVKKLDFKHFMDSDVELRRALRHLSQLLATNGEFV